MEQTERFINNMRKIIQERGYKQVFIARQMNISERKLSDILNNRKVIDIDIVLSLCNVLHVSPDELFGYTRSA